MRARHGVGARRRSGTWPFRSAPCLLIRRVVSAQLCARSTPSQLRRTPTCGYVDNASALPTYPQDQKTTKVSVNFDCLKAQQSDPVHHNPDRHPGQPRHPSPHSVSILAAIHTIASVARSTPCKCVCRADQRLSTELLPGLPFVAMQRCAFQRSRLHSHPSPRFATDIRRRLHAPDVVIAGKTRERS